MKHKIIITQIRGKTHPTAKLCLEPIPFWRPGVWYVWNYFSRNLLDEQALHPI